MTNENSTRDPTFSGIHGKFIALLDRSSRSKRAIKWRPLQNLPVSIVSLFESVSENVRTRNPNKTLGARVPSVRAETLRGSVFPRTCVSNVESCRERDGGAQQGLAFFKAKRVVAPGLDCRGVVPGRNDVFRTITLVDTLVRNVTGAKCEVTIDRRDRGTSSCPCHSPRNDVCTSRIKRGRITKPICVTLEFSKTLTLFSRRRLSIEQRRRTRHDVHLDK